MTVFRALLSIILTILLWACGSGGSTGSGTDKQASENPPVTTTFSATALDFPNPERGFFRFAADDFAAPDFADSVLQSLNEHPDESARRLVYAPVWLYPYRNGDPLPEGLLTSLSQSFERMRGIGVKVVLRFVYDNAAGENPALLQVTNHIAQLKDLLEKNADVIAFWQAGFIGAWGEWHYDTRKL